MNSSSSFCLCLQVVRPKQAWAPLLYDGTTYEETRVGLGGDDAGDPILILLVRKEHANTYQLLFPILTVHVDEFNCQVHYQVECEHIRHDESQQRQLGKVNN